MSKTVPAYGAKTPGLHHECVEITLPPLGKMRAAFLTYESRGATLTHVLRAVPLCVFR